MEKPAEKNRRLIGLSLCSIMIPIWLSQFVWPANRPLFLLGFYLVFSIIVFLDTTFSYFVYFFWSPLFTVTVPLGIGETTIAFDKIGALTFLVVYVIRLEKEDWRHVKEMGVWKPAMIFLAALLPTFINNPNKIVNLVHWTEQLFSVFFLIVACNILRTENVRKRWINLMILQATVVVAISIGAQYIGKYDIWFGKDIHFPYRITSTIGHPNFLGWYLVMTFFIVLYAFAKNSNFLIKASLFLFNIFVLWALQLTASLIAALVLLCSIGFLATFSTCRKLLTTILSIVVLSISLYVIFSTSFQTQNKFFHYREMIARTNPEHFSIRHRLFIWNVAVNSWKDHPIIGSGLGTFNLEYQSHHPNLPYLDEELRQAAQNASSESSYFRMLVETGLVGLAGFFVLISSIFLKYYSVFKKYKAEQTLLLFTIGAVIGGFLLHSAMEDIYHIFKLSLIFFTWVGLLWATDSQDRIEDKKAVINRESSLV